MSLSSPKFRRTLRTLEKHFADQAEQREDKAVKTHLAALRASIDNATKHRQTGTETMPYRLRIAVAFASLASALTSLYAWYPY